MNKQKPKNMKKGSSNLVILAFVLSLFFLFAAGKSSANSLTASDDLATAKKEGKTVFLIVTGSGKSDLTKSEKIAKDAITKVKNSVIIKLNKDDAANASVVNKLGISGVPVPFLLVISPKGIAVAGGTPEQVTADQLVQAVPSPKQDEALAALNDKKPVFIIVSKKGLTDKAAITSNCKTASSKISPKPIIIDVNVDDAKEAAFLKQIGVPSLNGKTKVVVANSNGQITATYEGKAEVDELTASANKVIRSGGCCPGGSSSGCK